MNARMAGSPIKRARREIREQALLRAAAIDQMILEAYEGGIDPVTLAMPVATKIYEMAAHGDPGNPVTLAACREFMDGVSGRLAQEVELGIQDERPGLTITIMQAALPPEPAAPVGQERLTYCEMPLSETRIIEGEVMPFLNAKG